MSKKLKKSVVHILLWGLAAAATSGCTCSEKKSNDPLRLRQRIDVSSVHLYASAKAALGSPQADAAVVAVRDKALKLLAEERSEDLSGIMSEMSLTDLMVLGKAMMSLKDNGKQIVAGTLSEGPPLIPKLLALLEAPTGYTNLVDANMDHALLFLATGVLKLHRQSPAPIPEEVVLYEAWRTDADKLTVPGSNALVQGLRAYFYGTNDFCDLAAEDAKAASSATSRLDVLLKGVEIFTEGAMKANVADIKQLVPVIRVIANSGVAACHYKRGDDKTGRPWLKAALDDIKAVDFAGSEVLGLIDIFYYCGGNSDEIAMGTQALAAMPPSASPTVTLDRQIVTAYCQASAETKSEAMRKLSLAKKLIGVALVVTENSKVIEAIERSKAYRSALGVAALSEKVATAGDSATGAMDALKGLFKNK